MKQVLACFLNERNAVKTCLLCRNRDSIQVRLEDVISKLKVYEIMFSGRHANTCVSRTYIFVSTICLTCANNLDNAASA